MFVRLVFIPLISAQILIMLLKGAPLRLFNEASNREKALPVPYELPAQPYGREGCAVLISTFALNLVAHLFLTTVILCTWADEMWRWDGTYPLLDDWGCTVFQGNIRQESLI